MKILITPREILSIAFAIISLALFTFDMPIDAIYVLLGAVWIKMG